MTFQDTTQQQQPAQGITETNDGILVGVDPSTAQRRAAEWGNGQQQQPQQQQPPVDSQGRRLFTEEEVETFRRQEKDKLYPEMTRLSDEVRAMREEREAEIAAREEANRQAQEAEEAATRQREEQEMDLRQLLERRDAEWQARFEEQQAQYAADRAVFDQERRLNELVEYRRARIEQESEFLLPEIREFISGNTAEEIDASIEFCKQQSNAIAANFAAAAQQQQQPFRGGAMPSVPPVGPLEQLPSYEQMSPEAIAAMDMDTYKRHRPQLLQAASQHQRRGR